MKWLSERCQFYAGLYEYIYRLYLYVHSRRVPFSNTRLHEDETRAEARRCEINSWYQQIMHLDYLITASLFSLSCFLPSFLPLFHSLTHSAQSVDYFSSSVLSVPLRALSFLLLQSHMHAYYTCKACKHDTCKRRSEMEWRLVFLVPLCMHTTTYICTTHVV